MTCSDGQHLNCTGEQMECGCVWEYCKECSYSVCYAQCDTVLIENTLMINYPGTSKC